MTRTPLSGAGPRIAHLRLMVWLLALAYFPALTFFGHWPLSVDIPGTLLYVGLPASSAPGAHNHKDHCHADAGSCSDTPVTTTATVAILGESIAAGGVESPFIRLAAGATRWSPQAGVTPLVPPPEASFQG